MEGVFVLILLLLLLLLLLIVIVANVRKSNRRKRRKEREFASVKFKRYDAESASTFRKVLKGPAYIVDGDTLVIRKTQIRLYGVDAPEMNHPYGKKAKWALFSLCKGQTIQAEIMEQDIHGRTVARCSLGDGRDLSAEMVKLGLALDWKKFSGGEYQHLELPNIRKKLWLADARQKGRLDVWERFEAQTKH